MWAVIPSATTTLTLTGPGATGAAARPRRRTRRTRRTDEATAAVVVAVVAVVGGLYRVRTTRRRIRLRCKSKPWPTLPQEPGPCAAMPAVRPSASRLPSLSLLCLLTPTGRFHRHGCPSLTSDTFSIRPIFCDQHWEIQQTQTKLHKRDSITAPQPRVAARVVWQTLLGRGDRRCLRSSRIRHTPPQLMHATVR